MTDKDQRPAENGAKATTTGLVGSSDSNDPDRQCVSRGRFFLEAQRRRYLASKRLPPLASGHRDPERADGSLR